MKKLFAQILLVAMLLSIMPIMSITVSAAAPTPIQGGNLFNWTFDNDSNPFSSANVGAGNPGLGLGNYRARADDPTKFYHEYDYVDGAMGQPVGNRSLLVSNYEGIFPGDRVRDWTQNVWFGRSGVNKLKTDLDGNIIHFSALLQNNDKRTNTNKEIIFGHYVTSSTRVEVKVSFMHDGKLRIDGTEIGVYSYFTAYKTDIIHDLPSKTIYVYLNGKLAGSKVIANVDASAAEYTRLDFVRISYNAQAKWTTYETPGNSGTPVVEAYYYKSQWLLDDIKADIYDGDDLADLQTSITANSILPKPLSIDFSTIVDKEWSGFPVENRVANLGSSAGASVNVNDFNEQTGAFGRPKADKSVQITTKAGTYYDTGYTSNPNFNINVRPNNAFYNDSLTYSAGDYTHIGFSFAGGENFKRDFSVMVEQIPEIRDGSNNITQYNMRYNSLIDVKSNGVITINAGAWVANVPVPNFSTWTAGKWYRLDCVVQTGSSVNDKNKLDLYIDGIKITNTPVEFSFKGGTYQDEFYPFDRISFIRPQYQANNTYNDATKIRTITEDAELYLDDVIIRQRLATGLNEINLTFGPALDGKYSNGGFYGIESTMTIADAVSGITNLSSLGSYIFVDPVTGAVIPTGDYGTTPVNSKTLQLTTFDGRKIFYNFGTSLILADNFDNRTNGSNPATGAGGYVDKINASHATDLTTESGLGGRSASDQSIVLTTTNMTVQRDASNNLMTDPYLNYAYAKKFEAATTVEGSIYIDDLTADRAIEPFFNGTGSGGAEPWVSHQVVRINRNGDITARFGNNDRVVGFAQPKNWYHFVLVFKAGGSNEYDLYINNKKINYYYYSDLNVATNQQPTLHFNVNYVYRLKLSTMFPVDAVGTAPEDIKGISVNNPGNGMTAFDDIAVYLGEPETLTPVILSSSNENIAVVDNDAQTVMVKNLASALALDLDDVLEASSYGIFDSAGIEVDYGNDFVPVDGVVRVFASTEYANIIKNYKIIGYVEEKNYADIVINQNPANQTVTATVNLTKYDIGSFTSMVLLASYDGNKLVGFTFKPVTTTKFNSPTSVTTDPITIANTDSVKAFVWQDSDTIKPIKMKDEAVETE